MEPAAFALLALAIFVVALLYSSVGHAGASGYIAVLTLFGLGVDVIRPTALTLNILVAAIGFIQWWRGGHFVWSLFWPFAVLSVPAAFLGVKLRVLSACSTLCPRIMSATSLPFWADRRTPRRTARVSIINYLFTAFLSAA